MASQPDFRFQEIDVLRGIAALVVVFSHYIPYWNTYLSPIPEFVPNAAGHDAVKLFFAISGFVIFFTLDRCKGVRDFAVLRFSRLYPAYWASLFVSTAVGVTVFGEMLWLSGVITNATMFHQFLGYGHLNNVYWSLTVELTFYLNVAWLFGLGLHRRPYWVVLGWLLFAAAWILLVRMSGTATGVRAEDLDRGAFALLFALDYAPYFAVGIVFYEVKRRGWTPAAAMLIALAVTVEAAINLWEGLLVATVTVALFVLALRGALKVFVCRATLWLGAISYSLYLIHRNLGYHVLDWMHAKGLGPFSAIALTTIGAVIAAACLTFAVEQPASIYVRAWYKRHFGRAPAESRRPLPVAATALSEAPKDER